MSSPKIIFGDLNKAYPPTSLKNLNILIIKKQPDDDLPQMLKELYASEDIDFEIIVCNGIETIDMSVVSHVDFIIIVPSVINQAFEEVLQETALIDESFFHLTRVCFVCLNLEETRNSTALLNSLRETYKDALVLPTPSIVTPFLVECIKNFITNVMGLKKNGKINILSRNMHTNLDKRNIDNADNKIRRVIEKTLKKKS